VRGEKLLTDRQIKTAKLGPDQKIKKLRDGAGLTFTVHRDGPTYAQFRYTFGGKEKVAQIGSYPDVTLEEARSTAEKFRRWLREGKDPVTEKRVEKAKGAESAASTFEAVFWEWMRKPRNPAWSTHHVERNEGLYRRLLKPAVGALPIAEITAAPLRRMMKDCQQDQILESGRRALAIAAQVLDYAIAHELTENNPARSILKTTEKPKVRHFKALKREDIGPFLRALDEDKTLDLVTKAGLYLMLVTGLRDKELRLARWKEFDLERGIWAVPGEHMKGRKVDDLPPHRVPLPRQALQVLGMLKTVTFTTAESFVFASARAKTGHMAENTLRLALHRLGFEVTAHGMRSLMTDSLNEAGFPSDWVERQLSHKEKDKVRRAYLRTDFLEQRVGMMQWFADYCEARKGGKSHDEAAGQSGNVVSLQAVKAA
jgi:integrase